MYTALYVCMYVHMCVMHDEARHWQPMLFLMHSLYTSSSSSCQLISCMAHVFDCRWEVLEAATGSPVLFAASLPANTTGPQVQTLHMMQDTMASYLHIKSGHLGPLTCATYFKPCNMKVMHGMQLIRSYMDTAVANNLNVMRIWAQTVGFNRAPFQTSPGVYNENIFRGLDYTLDQARQRNLKVHCHSAATSDV